MNTLTLESGYTLTMINDEEVALAGSIPGGNSFFGVSMLVLTAAVVIAALLFYFLRVKYYRRSIAKISENIAAGTGYSDARYNRWSLCSMKSYLEEMEDELAGKDAARVIL